MIIFRGRAELQLYIQSIKNEGKSIGFFPTMGALHEGHIALLHSSKKRCDLTVCSIFVNPTQFTNAEDLEKYPRTPGNDILLLEQNGCDVLFMPQSEDIYSGEKPLNLYLGNLETSFEGSSRPGHFTGVARIVRLLLEAVDPHDAFFGWKDLQQCLVIDSMVKQLNMKFRLHFMPTLREADGLAMSSRNRRLNSTQREAAPLIYKALSEAREKVNSHSVSQIISDSIALIESSPELTVDYFAIADPLNLEPLHSVEGVSSPVALAAVFAGNIRLIDNLFLK